MDLPELSALFRKLGAPEPESWARSQLEEGLPQLARYVFLREAWRNIVSEDDRQWMAEQVAQAEADPDAPFSGVGQALSRLRAKGADDQDIVDVVRGAQAQLLFDLCTLLDDPGSLEPELEGLGWSLVQITEDDEIVALVEGLHESVLETDPTGREMRPR